jgi:hypothetical protein
LVVTEHALGGGVRLVIFNTYVPNAGGPGRPRLGFKLLFLEALYRRSACVRACVRACVYACVRVCSRRVLLLCCRWVLWNWTICVEMVDLLLGGLDSHMKTTLTNHHTQWRTTDRGAGWCSCAGTSTSWRTCTR